MQIILLWLKKLRQILKHLNLKLVIGSGQLSIRIFLAKVTPIIGQEKYWKLILELVFARRFYFFEIWSWKIDINIMVNVQTGLNDLKTNVDDLDVDKVKTVTADLNKLNDIVKRSY